MIAKEKKLERQVEIWALLGPFIMIMTLTVILIKPIHHQLYIPLAALLGIPICWKWKLPGLAVSIGMLSALIAYQFIYSPQEIIFWDFILGIAVALTFGITALSYKEIDFVLKHLQTESSARLQSFLKADERIKALEIKHESDLAIQVSKTAILQDNLTEKAHQLHTYEHIVNVAREELLHTIRKNEELQQEVFNKRHEMALLLQKVEDSSCIDSEIKELNDQIAKLEAEKSVSNKSLEQLQSELESIKTADNEKTQNVEECNAQIVALRAESKASKESLGHLQKEFESLITLDNEKTLKLEEYSEIIQKLKGNLLLNEQELVQYRQKTEELVEAYSNKETVLANQLNQALCDKEKAEFAMNSLEKEKSELLGKLADSPKASPEDVQAYKRAQGMYIQLKEQFEEKCTILDETRRELFLAQESLMKLQRDIEEERKYSTNENEAVIASLLKKMDEELSEIKYERQETEALHRLIQQLTNSCSATHQTELSPPKEETEVEKTTKEKPKKASTKKKPVLKTKTKDWADTIMSRWSDK